MLHQDDAKALLEFAIKQRDEARNRRELARITSGEQSAYFQREWAASAAVGVMADNLIALVAGLRTGAAVSIGPSGAVKVKPFVGDEPDANQATISGLL